MTYPEALATVREDETLPPHVLYRFYSANSAGLKAFSSSRHKAAIWAMS